MEIERDASVGVDIGEVLDANGDVNFAMSDGIVVIPCRVLRPYLEALSESSPEEIPSAEVAAMAITTPDPDHPIRTVEGSLGAALSQLVESDIAKQLPIDQRLII